MKKTWFIIEKDYHRGPYSFEDLKNLKSQGKLHDRSLLWQETNSKGITFAEACEIERKITETLIPDVPVRIPVQLARDSRDSNEPPSIPTEKYLSEGDLLKPTVETSVLDKIQIPEVKNTSIKKVAWMYFAILFSLVLILAGGLFYFYIGRTPVLEYPIDMSQSDYERLSPVIDTRFVSEMVYELAPAKDLSRLWLAVNYPYQSELLLEMTSIKEKTLQNKEIKVKAKATLNNYLAEFRDFKFEEMEGKFYPGFYQLKISLIESSDSNLMMKLTYKNKIFKDIQIKEFFWGQGNKEDFIKLIDVAKEKAINIEPVEENESEAVQTLREKEEKLRTLLSLVILTDDETKKTLSNIESQNLLKNPKELKKAFADYEKKYVREVAPLLTSLGQDSDLGEAKILGKLFVETLDSLKSNLKKLEKRSNKTKQKAPISLAFAQDKLLKFKELEANLEQNLKLVEEAITVQKAQENNSKIINKK